MNIQTGIFLRGVLVGTKLTKNRYIDRNGQNQENSYTEIGIEVSFVNGFGQEQLEQPVSVQRKKRTQCSFRHFQKIMALWLSFQ